MKTTVILLNIFLGSFTAGAQNFTWMNGDSIHSQKVVYGVKGVAAPGNDPGARYGSVSFHDASGNLWLFGGYAQVRATYSARMNDLWKYDVQTNLWTWVSGDSVPDQWGRFGPKGVSSPTTVPGARQWAVGWSDLSGKLWVFGGWGNPSLGNYGFYPNTLNDLWSYDISQNEWTWMGGDSLPEKAGLYGLQGVSSPTACPGARMGGLGWSDNNGNLWLFGGSGYAKNSVGLLNDVWKYNISSGHWTWVHGSQFSDQNGTYGVKNVSAPTNVPGSRYFAAGAFDGASGFYLYGGDGYSVNSSGHYFLGDLWKFNLTTNEWTWISGSMGTYGISIYGTKGITAPNNSPGSRWGCTGFCDMYGNFWVFGGVVHYSPNNADALNDLWVYQPGNSHWGWIAGSNTFDSGLYGTQGQGTAFTRPNGKRFPGLWFTSNTLWILGGQNNWFGGDNWSDLWKYPLGEFLPVNISQNSSSSTFQLFPNPSDGYVTINCGDKNPEALQARVYDSKGNLVLAQSHQKNESESFNLDLRDLNPGIFFIHLTDGNSSSTIKHVTVH